MSSHAERRALPFLAGGLVLLAAFFAALLRIPHTIHEFAYYPFNPAPLPWAPMRGFTVEQAADHLARLLLFAPALALLAIGIARRWPIDERLPRIAPRTAALAVSCASLVLISVVMFDILRGRAIVDDELTYSSTADFFLEGRIGGEVPPGMPREPFSIRTNRGLTGKYLPGESLVQVPGAAIGQAALMHLPLAALTLFCLWQATLLLSGDERLAAWSVALVAASPMFILCSATMQSQPSSLAALAVAGLGVAHAMRGRAWLGALLLGIGVDLAVLCRIQSAVPFGTVLVLFAIAALWRRRAFPSLALLVAILAGGAASIAMYDAMLSGSPLTLPWTLYKPVEHYGFGQVLPIDSFRHSARTLIENLGVVLVRMNAWWLGWPVSLPLLVFGRRGRLPLHWMIGAIVFVVVQAGYYSTGVSDVGQIYHYELLIPLALLGASAIVTALERNRRLAVAVLVVGFGLGTTQFLWTQTARVYRLVTAIHRDAEAALAEMQTPALLLHEFQCSETLSIGWVQASFPVRWRTPRHEVITYPRPLPRFVSAYEQHFANRRCYYFRRNPQTMQPELYRCDDPRARQLMARPILATNCMYIPSTAEELGWYHPWQELAKRRTGHTVLELR
jgi:hypothetical protein